MLLGDFEFLRRIGRSEFLCPVFIRYCQDRSLVKYPPEIPVWGQPGSLGSLNQAVDCGTGLGSAGCVGKQEILLV